MNKFLTGTKTTIWQSAWGEVGHDLSACYVNCFIQVQITNLAPLASLTFTRWRSCLSAYFINCFIQVHNTIPVWRLIIVVNFMPIYVVFLDADHEKVYSACNDLERLPFNRSQASSQRRRKSITMNRFLDKVTYRSQVATQNGTTALCYA